MKWIVLMVFLCACTKTEVCVTCEEQVKYQSQNQPVQEYIQSSTVYCDDSWEQVDGRVVKSNGMVQGVTWKKTVTTVCH